MSLEFTLFFIVSSQFLLLEPCYSRPIFNYLGIFDEKEESPPTTTEESAAISENEMDFAENTTIKPDVQAAVITSSPAEKVMLTQPLSKPIKETHKLLPMEMEPTQARLGNAGFPWALNTVALAARVLNHGVQGTKKLVEGSTDLTAQALGGVKKLGNGVIDGVKDAIDTGAQRTLSRVSRWMDATNSYRKGLSGTTAKAPDRGHSITITTASDAPVKSFNEFISNYLPSGTGTGSLPEITSIDLSKLW